jgi:TP901-1 family phage major tail protein
MAAKLGGRNLLLYIEDAVTPGQYNLVGGMQANTLTLAREFADVTDKQSVPFRTQADFGTVSGSIAGNGVSEDDAMLLRIEAAILNVTVGSAILNFRIISGTGTQPRRYQGAFAITSFERTGEYNGAETFSIALESAGVITLTNKVP